MAKGKYPNLKFCFYLWININADFFSAGDFKNGGFIFLLGNIVPGFWSYLSFFTSLDHKDQPHSQYYCIY
jgi:hypothetical protein